MTSDVLGALLKAQPEGKQMWLAVRGSSMRPLLTGGESLKVVRCSESALRRGDIAVMLRADGAMVSHLVVSTVPLRTESFTGKPDADLEVLARAVAIRRGGVVVPLPFPARPALLGLQRAWSFAARSPVARGAWGLAVDVLASPRTAGLRTLLGRAELELLGPDQLRKIAIALSRWVTLSGAALEALVRDAVVLGVIRRGQLVGLAFGCPDGVVRHAFLQRRAQGLGLEFVILDRAIRESAARGVTLERIEVDPAQKGFLAAAQQLGLR